ncbi:patatin-like protein [Janibacter sp. GXQ6167]|uniref:patatin-like protein n=1 Tax=Janibacter sp. GXQ6167 TaxID=3240791 RepID=UPI003523501A
MERNHAVGERELRIAPVMTGGFSLAVWMGGATVELYRLLESRDAEGGGNDLYRRLLDLTQTRPVVDVVTGTSAGGINGAMLAAAVAWQVPVAEVEDVREVWTQAADLGRLIRRSSEPDPPSILDGDGAFYPVLRDRLARWCADRRAAGERMVDLVTTFTAVTARHRVLVDDFGEVIDEDQRAGTLRFRTEHFADPEACEMPAKLAWASRATASVPVIFEPVYLPIGRSEAGRPDVGPHVSLGGIDPGSGLWAVDGGLINNLPLGAAVQRIFRCESAAEVRRVVLYVSPTPVPAGADLEPGPEHADDPPSALTVAVAAVNAFASEGVKDDLREITDHNLAVRRQRAARAGIAITTLDLGTPIDGPVPQAIMRLYRRRRAEDSVALTLGRIEQVVTPSPQDWSRQRAVLQRALLTARSAPERLPEQVPSPEDVTTEEWAWGIAPVEQAVSLALGLINRTLGLPIVGRSEGGEGASDPSGRDRLIEAKARVHEVRRTLDVWRDRNAEYWREQAPRLRAATAADVDQAAEAAYAGWPGGGTGERARAFTALRDAMEAIAGILASIEEDLLPLLQRAGGTAPQSASRGDADAPDPVSVPLPPSADEVTEEAHWLWAEYRSVVPPARDDRRVARVMVALLRSHIYQEVLLSGVVPREQPVEVLQVSWNSPDYLSGTAPEDKLVGTEFARFGAFVKQSWRANDYLWGQLDAAARLVLLVLDPHRLVQLARTSGEVIAQLGLDPGDAGLREELAFLDEFAAPAGAGSDRTIPLTLPRLSAAVASRRQHQIASEGLGGVADAVRRGAAAGEGLEPEARAFLDAYDAAAKEPDGRIAPEAVSAVMQALRIGERRGSDELGSAAIAGAARRLARASASLAKGLARRSDTPAFARIPLRLMGIGLRLTAMAAWFVERWRRLRDRVRREPTA